jgi:serine/threonine protein kinase
LREERRKIDEQLRNDCNNDNNNDNNNDSDYDDDDAKGNGQQPPRRYSTRYKSNFTCGMNERYQLTELARHIAERGWVRLFVGECRSSGMPVCAKGHISSRTAGRHEADILERLQHHRCVVKLIEWWEPAVSRDKVVLVMELLQPLSFDHRLMSEAFIEAAAVQLLTALDKVHRDGVVHCDVKPDNIMLRPLPTATSDELIKRGEVEFVLIDFGESHLYPQMRLPKIGTKPYIAPELYDKSKLSGGGR